MNCSTSGSCTVDGLAGFKLGSGAISPSAAPVSGGVFCRREGRGRGFALGVMGAGGSPSSPVLSSKPPLGFERVTRREVRCGRTLLPVSCVPSPSVSSSPVPAFFLVRFVLGACADKYM